MTQGQVETSTTVEYGNPAVGIIVSTATVDSAIRTIVRARERSIAVIIVSTGLAEETNETFRKLGATVIEGIEEAEDCYRTSLVDAAQRHNYEGILIHEGDGWIDFEASRERFLEGTEYVSPTETRTSLESPDTGLLVGIPAYNEEVGIGSTVTGALPYADEVVVIDDGSQDRTVEIARETGATVLEHETNHGKGRALNTFFTYARSTDHDQFVILDGDGQHIPSDIPRVAEPIKEGDADMVIGSRYLEEGTGSETPRYRRVGQQLLDLLTVGSSGQNLTDTQSGFRAFSPAAIDLLTIRTDGMGVETEIIGTAVDSELKITEVPIDVRYDGIDGQTYNPVRHGIGVAAFTLKLIRDRHPLLFFGLPGLAFIVIGSSSGISSAYLYTTQGSFALGQTLIAILFTQVGILGVFCGLVLNRMANMINEI